MEKDWSVPESDVVDAAATALAENQEAVLATIVDVEGSAFRRPGAKMLVTPEGGVGAITAGCLEDEVEGIAAEVLADGRRRVETYDLMEDDDDVWGLGMGCNGVIDVMLEPLAESYRPVIEAYRDGEAVAVLTVLSGPREGQRTYYRPDTGTTTAVDGAGLDDDILTAVEGPAATLLGERTSDTLTVTTTDGEVRVFVDAVTPPPDLVVFGTGHDVGPVVELAKRNGFKTTVVAFRGGTDLAERFPHADRTLSTSPARLGDDVDLDDSTYTVVMTHNFVDDRLALEELLASATPYIGLMGPDDRFEEMLEAFAAEGRQFDEADLASIYTPVGLNLGAGSPYGIATSIVAEVLAVHNDREPGHLSAQEGPIHERLDVEAVEPTTH